MLHLNLKKLFRARGIEKPYTFLVKSGFVPFTAHKYKTGEVDQIRLNHIEQLCISLNCTPNDIFEWQPNDLLDDRRDHPLQAIRRKEKKLEINRLLSKISLSDLEEVHNLLEQKLKAI